MKKLKLIIVVAIVSFLVGCTVPVVVKNPDGSSSTNQVIDPKLQAGLDVAAPIVAAAPAPWGWIGGTVLSSIGAIALGVVQYKNRKR